MKLLYACDIHTNRRHVKTLLNVAVRRGINAVAIGGDVTPKVIFDQYGFEMFGPHWHVLFCHLLLFYFIYPSERVRIPVWIMETLMANLKRELKSNLPLERICWGTLLSKTQYMFDIDRDGYRDGRYTNRH